MVFFIFLPLREIGECARLSRKIGGESMRCTSIQTVRTVANLWWWEP